MTDHIGVSKLRLMAGRSGSCVVCETPLTADDRPHQCADHAHIELVVVDSQSMPDPHRIGERWTTPEEPSWLH